MSGPEPLPDADGLARFLGVGRGTVDELRRSGRIPFIRIGPKTIRFHPQDVVDALRAQVASEKPEPEWPTRSQLQDVVCDRDEFRRWPWKGLKVRVLNILHGEDALELITVRELVEGRKFLRFRHAGPRGLALLREAVDLWRSMRQKPSTAPMAANVVRDPAAPDIVVRDAGSERKDGTG